MKNTKVLFVCLGNICRSPTAHAVFRQLAKEKNISVEVDSAGTSAHHKGAKPDPRSKQVGEDRGYDFSGLHARKVDANDYTHFDYIVAMDEDNYRNLEKNCPDEYKKKLFMFMSFSKEFDVNEVPDPYYGGAQGFKVVFDYIESASNGLLAKLVEE